MIDHLAPHKKETQCGKKPLPGPAVQSVNI